MSGTDKKGKHEIAPIIRRSFVRAVARICNGDSEKELADLMEENLRKNFLATLQAVARYEVTESKVTKNVVHEHKLSEIERVNRINTLLEAGRVRRDESASDEGSMGSSGGATETSTTH